VRVVLISAGTDAKAAVKACTTNLVSFEGKKSAWISQALLEETRKLLIELMPVFVEASEQGLHVCLTGLGAGGSLSSTIALECALFGLCR
jgi:hypothetical protein